MGGGEVRIAFDLYPASIEVQSTTYRPARVLVADGQLLAYRLGSSGVETLYEREVTGPITGSVGVGIVVPTVDGDIWVARDGGCACGSRLRDVDLFPGQRKVVTGLR